MTRWAIGALVCLGLTGCCSGLRASVRAYGEEAAASAAATRILVERCRDGDAEACAGAIEAIDAQRESAEILAGIE